MANGPLLLITSKTTPPQYKLKLTSTDKSKPAREYWWDAYDTIWPHFLSDLRILPNNIVHLNKQ